MLNFRFIHLSKVTTQIDLLDLMLRKTHQSYYSVPCCSTLYSPSV